MALQATSGIAVLVLIVVVILISIICISCRGDKEYNSGNHVHSVSHDDHNQVAMQTEPDQDDETKIKQEDSRPMIWVGKFVKYSSYIIDHHEANKPDCDSSCAICLEEFKGEDDCRVLPTCKHVFHETCIDKWLTSNLVCPICRAGVFQFDLEAAKPTPLPDHYNHVAWDWIAGVLHA